MLEGMYRNIPLSLLTSEINIIKILQMLMPWDMGLLQIALHQVLTQE